MRLQEVFLVTTELKVGTAMNEYFSEKTRDKDVPKPECPDTDEQAGIVSSLPVSNCVVIHATHATYRRAHFGGTFVVAKPDALPTTTEGWHAVEVYCLWYKRRLKTRGPRFMIDMSQATVERSFTGKVHFKIAR